MVFSLLPWARLSISSCYGPKLLDPNNSPGSHSYPDWVPLLWSGPQYRTSVVEYVDIDASSSLAGMDAPFCGGPAHTLPCATLWFAMFHATGTLGDYDQALQSRSPVPHRPMTTWRMVGSGNYAAVQDHVINQYGTSFVGIGTQAVLNCSSVTSDCMYVRSLGFTLANMTTSGGSGFIIDTSISGAVFDEVSFVGQLSTCGK